MFSSSAVILYWMEKKLIVTFPYKITTELFILEQYS